LYSQGSTYLVKIRKCDLGSPEEFLNWRIILNEQIKNNGYGEKYKIVMNLAQAILTGRGLDSLLNELREQETKNNMYKAYANKTESTPKQIYDMAIF
jgi:hypothetical protein